MNKLINIFRILIFFIGINILLTSFIVIIKKELTMNDLKSSTIIYKIKFDRDN